MSSPQIPSASEERSLRDIAALVQQHRQLLLLFVASAMASSLVITYVFSEKYQAATLIMYRPTDAIEVQPNPVIPDKTALGFPIPALPFEAVGATIERVGKSERVLRRVVEELGLDQPEVNEQAGWAWYYHELKSTAKTWLGNTWDVLKFGRVIAEDPATDAIIGLMKYVTIEPREDYTSTLIVVNKSPDRAALIVDRIGRILVEEIKELTVQSARERSEELANRLAAKDQQLQAVRSKIEQLQEQERFHSLRDEMPLHLSSLETFEAKLLENEQSRRDARARLTSLVAQRAGIEATIPSSEIVQDDPLYAELQALLSRYRVEWQGLLHRRGPQHVDVVALIDKINNLEDQLADLEVTRVTNQTTSTNPAYEAVLLEEITARSLVEGLDAARESLQEGIGYLRARIVPPHIVSEMKSLELQLQTLEDDYLHLAAALEEAKTAELAGVPEVRILFPATPIRTPLKPIKIYHVVLTGLLAASMGLAAIFLTDFLKSRWYTPLATMSAPMPAQT